MDYSKEAIERRNFRANLIKKVLRKVLFILMIVGLYNAFLITKSALDDAESKDIFGYKAYIITTESMRPAIKVGDAIIVEKVPEEKLKPGDIITIKSNDETTITHRIIEIKENKEIGENEYITKGDNNNVEDAESIGYDQIQGRKVVVIPLFGKLLLALKNKMYIAIIILVILIITVHVINSQRKVRKRREKKIYEDRKAEEDKKNSNQIS